MEKKLSNEEIKEITAKVKPFFKEYWELFGEFGDKIKVLEEKMNKEINPKTKIEFFYVDGEMAGIGAENYSDREWFPLIPDEFENED